MGSGMGIPLVPKVRKEASHYIIRVSHSTRTLCSLSCGSALLISCYKIISLFPKPHDSKHDCG